MAAPERGSQDARLLVSHNDGRTFSKLSPGDYLGGLGCNITATSPVTLWGFCVTGKRRLCDSFHGRRWKFVNLQDSWGLSNGVQVYPVSDSEAIFYVLAGDVWLTRNGGKRLSVLLRVPRSSYYDCQVALASAKTWLVLGRSGYGPPNLLWRTTDEGRSWQSVKAPTVSTLLPVVDLSVTPKGWVPVAYGDAQLSVPPGFPVAYPGQTSFCSGASASGPGGLLVDTPLGETAHCVVERHPTMVYWASVPHPSSVAFEHIRKKSVLLNGLRVFRIPTAVTYFGYYAPSLGVQVITQGPLGQRILATLTRSPRTVALASGSAPAVPYDWRTVTFQGLAFAAPSSWPVSRTTVNLGIGQPCSAPGVALGDSQVDLSTDNRLGGYRCIYFGPIPEVPHNGIRVDAGSEQ